MTLRMLSVKVPGEMLEEADKAAELAGINRSELIRRSLEQELKRLCRRLQLRAARRRKAAGHPAGGVPPAASPG